ncbi:MAG: extracellular solute-binding protein [Pseudomonadota bacterium]
MNRHLVHYLVIGLLLVLGPAFARAACESGEEPVRWAIPNDEQMLAALAPVVEDLSSCVVLESFPVGELFDRYSYELAVGSGGYDLVTLMPAWLGPLSVNLQAMPVSLYRANGDTFSPVLEDLMTWEGVHYAQAISGTGLVLYYRADMFADPVHQEGFRAIFDAPLAPPETWAQYSEVASYFSQSNQTVQGTGEIYRRGHRQFWYLYSRAVSLSDDPSPFFNLQDMTPLVDAPPWQQALENYLAMREYNPSQFLRLTRGQLHDLFTQGEIAMLIDWVDGGPLLRDEASPLPVEALGVVRLPGSKQRWNADQQDWIEHEETAPPLLAFGGWLVAVPVKAHDQSWQALAEIHEALAGVIVPPGPYRATQLMTLPGVWSETETGAYIDAVQATLGQGRVGLRLSGYLAYGETFELELGKSLIDGRTPEETLAAIKARWMTLTDDFGKENQRTLYRKSLNLPR